MKKKSSNDTDKLIWERDEPVITSPPTPLTRESIVSSAISIADKEGLSSVSFRKIGAFMGAGHMRLYTYFATKEELLELMIDTFFGEVVTTEALTSDWRENIRIISRKIRKAALNHPWIMDILGSRPHQSPNALIYIEGKLDILYKASETKDIDSVFLASMALNAYVIGFIRNELSELRAESEKGLDNQTWQVTTESYMRRMIDTGKFPTLAKVLNNAKQIPLETEFIHGLECVLDGIELRLIKSKKTK